jgi:GDPmannose 4,6-dehydratase
MNDVGSLYKLFSQYKFDEVYNLAAQSHVRVSFEVPEETADAVAMGPLRLLECIKTMQPDCRFYQASSSEMFGDNPEHPQNEETRLMPASPYACAKVFAHGLTRNYREGHALHVSSGILFNHESPRRGETFVTRKITRGLANIAQGLEKCLFMGNMDSLRDWGHAKDYVRMQWMMLQQENPEDYVIATGVQYSVRDFINKSAARLGIELAFEGHGVDEVVRVVKLQGDDAPALKVGDEIVKIDPRYFRPAEVETLLGDPTKAKEKLGWVPEISLDQMIAEMISHDLETAKQHSVLKKHGFKVNIGKEN